jgi:hypothetical protein
MAVYYSIVQYTVLYVVSSNKYYVTTDSLCIELNWCNFMYMCFRFLGAFAELRKRSLASSGMSIRKKKLGSQWMDFDQI